MPAITTCYVLIYYLRQHAYTKVLCLTSNYNYSYPIAKARVLLWNTIWSIGILSYKIRYSISYNILYLDVNEYFYKHFIHNYMSLMH